MDYQWYPGHMTRARRQMQEDVRLVDLVIELTDARAPLSGRNPDKSSLMEGTGDDLVRSFYNGCLEYLQTPNEYLFYDVFPDAPLVQTNADTKIINLRSKSRFPTVMCRSIDARQVGLSEATNVLYLDDCVEGREEAKNRQRLDDKWEVISGDILGRAIEGTPIVATGTRYSLYDPIGHLQEEAQKGGWAWKAIEIPALDPITDESNYEYALQQGQHPHPSVFHHRKPGKNHQPCRVRHRAGIQLCRRHPACNQRDLVPDCT